uniref:Tyrosine specific protein phosphatases domain-containing protein n=1 Tax=Peronospora matthiolae TaxID=2874970 RepID=A0AAV1T3M4_9STRA
MVKPKNRIPDNWVDVAKMGTLVGTSRFAALRVPLDFKFLPQFKSNRDELWTPHDFLALQRDRHYNVQMVIDLTNTSKYYNGEREFQNTGVQYIKLPIEGFYGPPEAREVNKFVKLVDEFIQKSPYGAIAVHCTHGLNRTGYLVVTYLVKRLRYSVTAALAAFKAARPPGLIKHMYVEDLYKQLGAGEQVQWPVLPQWASAKYSMRADYSQKKKKKKAKGGGEQCSKKKAKGAGQECSKKVKGGGKECSRKAEEGGQVPVKRSKKKKRSKTLTNLENVGGGVLVAPQVGKPKSVC